MRTYEAPVAKMSPSPHLVTVEQVSRTVALISIPGVASRAMKKLFAIAVLLGALAAGIVRAQDFGGPDDATAPVAGMVFQIDALVPNPNDERTVKVIATGLEIRPQAFVVDVPKAVADRLHVGYQFRLAMRPTALD